MEKKEESIEKESFYNSKYKHKERKRAIM